MLNNVVNHEMHQAHLGSINELSLIQGAHQVARFDCQRVRRTHMLENFLSIRFMTQRAPKMLQLMSFTVVRCLRIKHSCLLLIFIIDMLRLLRAHSEKVSNSLHEWLIGV